MKPLILLLTCSFFFLSSTTENINEPDTLGFKLCEYIKSNNVEAFKELILTKEEMIALLNKIEIPKKIKKEVMKDFDKMIIQMDAEKEKMIKKFNIIHQSFIEKGCAESVEVYMVQPKIEPLKNLPFELGTIYIIYDCNSERDTITAEITKTNNGWKIAGHLR